MTATAKKWDEARRVFSERLFARASNHVELLSFTVCPDPAVPPDDLCRVAAAMCGPVQFLKQQTGLEWLTIVQYDTREKEPEKVHAKHLNFYVHQNLKQNFEEEAARMFLMTGVACGVSGYDARIDGKDKNETFPPFILCEGCDSLDLKGDWVFYSVTDSSSCCPPASGSETTGADGGDCRSCTHDARCNICAPQDSFALKYIHNIADIDTKKKKLARTLRNFKTIYPVASVTTDKWCTLFIPGVHFPEQPFYMNGALISFKDSGDVSSHLELLETWTRDVCTAIASLMWLHTASFHGPWTYFGAGGCLDKFLSITPTKEGDGVCPDGNTLDRGEGSA